MKKSVLITSTLLFLLLSINTYGSGIGIRGGMNFSSLPSTTQLTVNGATVESLSDSYTGFHFGLVGHLSLFNFFIQPEFLYTQTGQRMYVRQMPDDLGQHFDNTYSHLSIPVIGGTSFGPLRVGVGPVLSILLDSKQGFSNIMGDDLDFENNGATFGFQAMAGVKIGNIMLDLKYEGSLSRLSDGVNIGDNQFDFDTRPRQFIISLGILVF